MKILLLTFARAVWWGSIAGAAPYTILFMLPLGIAMAGDGEPLGMLLMIAYPLVISAVIVLAAALLIGLPLTAILSQSVRERQVHYALAGLGAGAAIPALIILAVDGGSYEPVLFFAVPGMVAGTVTGLVWGKWREALVDDAASDLADD